MPLAHSPYSRSDPTTTPSPRSFDFGGESDYQIHPSTDPHPRAHRADPSTGLLNNTLSLSPSPSPGPVPVPGATAPTPTPASIVATVAPGEVHLTCPLCQGPYRAHSARPKRFPCQHVVCEWCAVETMRIKSKSGHTWCPITGCGQPIGLAMESPELTVEMLPDCPEILALLGGGGGGGGGGGPRDGENDGTLNDMDVDAMIDALGEFRYEGKKGGKG